MIKSKRALSPPPKLKGMDFTEEEIKKARDNNKMLMISPFVTKLCNLRCKYCYAKAGRPAKNELDLKEYKEIVRQAKELGARTVWIAGAGEPMLQKGFFELAEYITKLNMWLVFFTNGTLMTLEKAKRLYKLNTSIIAKFNSFNNEVQDWLAGRNWSYEKIQNGLNNLIKVGFNKTNPSRLGVESVIAKQNIEELPAIFIWAREHHIIPCIEMMIHGGRARRYPELHVTPTQTKKLFFELLKIDQDKFGYTWTPSPPYVAGRCDKLFYHVVIDHEGHAKPCCGVDVKVGNIRDKSLKEIWNSPFLLRTRHLDKYVKGKCKHCKIRGCYYGCRCDAFQHTGDAFGPYQECWYRWDHVKLSPKDFFRKFNLKKLRT